MKPEQTVYEAIPKLPRGGFRNIQTLGMYCRGCGHTFSMERKDAFSGRDESGKAYINECLFCFVDVNLVNVGNLGRSGNVSS